LAAKILITGCTGLVGRGLTNYFLRNGYEVLGTHIQSFESLNKNFHPLVLELKSLESIKNLFQELKEIDMIIHNAAYVPKNSMDCEINSDEIIETNFTGTKRLLKFSEISKIKKFIFISGTAIVDKTRDIIDEGSPYYPQNSYYSSKILSEILCSQYIIEKKMNINVFRISAPYGSNTKSAAVIPKFIDSVRNSKDITLWGTGTREQVFTFVDDIAYACDLTLDNNVAGIFNIVGGSSITMKDLATEILKLFPDSKSKIVFTGDVDPQEGRSVTISYEKAKKELGYSPQFSISDGLKEMIKRENSESFFKILDN
jgi:nucleoside-diphosphate-sugar epimerase